MSSIKRIIQAVAMGIVLMQLATGWGIATAGAQEPENFPAEEFPFDSDEMDIDYGDIEFSQADAEEVAAASAAMLAMMVMFGLIGLAVGYAILALICWLLSSALAAIPQEYRDMEPGMVWLLLIPLFPLVWNFFVYRRIPSSFQKYFAAQGVTDRGDCGDSIGLWYSICVVLGCIPCVNYIAGPAALILLIIFLVKITGMKGQVKAATAGTGA
jgi:hypothetical protein